MDCNFTTIKTCELKDSTFRSRILDFGDFDISDYTFSAVYKAGFDQVISEQELTAIGNILTVPLEAIEGASNRAKAEVWMLRDGGFKDKVIVFDVVISATGCPTDSTVTDGVSVTFGGLTVPVEVNQGIVNISREVAFSTLSPEEQLELKGEPFVYEDFTPEQLATLKGPQGDPLTFSDLTTQQVNELKQPALDAAVIATTAAQNADTAAGLATDAAGQATAATSSANGAASAANIAAENANEAAGNALTGISGEATEVNSPEPTGFHRYIVTEPITTGSAWGIEVTQAELNDNWVFFHVTDGVITKYSKPANGTNAKIPTYNPATSYAAGSQIVSDNTIYRVIEGKALNIGETPISNPEKAEILTKYVRRKIRTGWVLGGLNATGPEIPGNTRIRSEKLKNVSSIELLTPNTSFAIVNYYNDGVFVSAVSNQTSPYKVVYPSGANQVQFAVRKVDNSVFTEAEVNAFAYKIYTADVFDIEDKLKNIEKLETILPAIETIPKMAGDYNSIVINKEIGLFEFGGINASNGANTSLNNVRTRSKSEISVKNNKTYKASSLSGGLTLHSVYRYLNGVFVSYSTINASQYEFTVDSTYNAVRFVFAKNPNTLVITQQELDDFSFTFTVNELVFEYYIPKIEENEEKIENLIQEVDDVKNAALSNPFFGLEMVSIGDSITAGFIPRNYAGYPGVLDSYAKQAADLLGMSFQNLGISGSTLGQLSAGDTTSNSPFIHRFQSASANARIVTFMGGTNDLRKINVLGVMTDRVGTTFYGALHILIQGLLNKYIYSQPLTTAKNVLIVGITPIKLLGYPNIANYANTVKEVCAYYSIPCFDAHDLSGITPDEFKTLQGTAVDYTGMYNPLITDGTHPTTEGHAIFAQRFAAFLKTLV